MVSSFGDIAGGGVKRPRYPYYRVTYEGVGLFDDASNLVEQIELTENLAGESDSVSLTLNNGDLRWYNEYFPQIGDRMTVSLGYRGESFTEPVTFEVDEPTFKIAPDIVQIKGQATPVVPPIRQRYHESFEQFTLPELAQWVADKYGLELIGNVPEIRFNRVTQKNEPDLAWLKKLALRYGVIFKVESCERLIFYTEEELEKVPPSVTVTRQFLSDDGSSSFKAQATDTYKRAQTDYKDPKTAQLYQVEVEANNPFVRVDSTLRITGERYENIEQAALRCREALRTANATAVEMTLDVEGEVTWRAGMNIELDGARDQFGGLGGVYQIRKVKHKLVPQQGRKQGWRTTLTGRLIAPGDFAVRVTPTS